MRLRLANRAGRDTADAVEVFVRVTRPSPLDGPAFGIGDVLVVDDANLNFESPLVLDGPGQTTTTVPSGYSRPVSIAVIGRVELPGYASQEPGHCGWVAVCPPFAARHIGLVFDAVHTVTIVVAGANFDAVTYEGELVVQQTVQPDRSRGTQGVIEAEWTKPPEPISYSK
jgi:hypothetical protein